MLRILILARKSLTEGLEQNYSWFYATARGFNACEEKLGKPRLQCLKKGTLQAWYNSSFLIRTESEMLNLKSGEIHWIFHTVSEIGWIPSARVFAKPSLSHHTEDGGRLLQLWC